MHESNHVKPSSFLLSNAAHLKSLRYQPGEIFRPYMKFPAGWIYIVMTGFQSQNLAEQQQHFC